jgi:hypothetical protein
LPIPYISKFNPPLSNRDGITPLMGFYREKGGNEYVSKVRRDENLERLLFSHPYPLFTITSRGWASW